MSTLDDLYDLRTFFYTGAYAAVISEGSGLTNLNSELEFEKNMFIARACIALGHFDKLMTLVGPKINGTVEFECLKVLAAYVKSKSDANVDQSMVAASCLEAIEQYLSAVSSIHQKLIASSIYIQEGLLEPAYNLLCDSSNPECAANVVYIYLQLFRFDLAAAELSKLKSLTNDSVLCQVTEAAFLICKGEDYQSAYYIVQELIEANGANAFLLNLQAVCSVHMDKLSEAENLLLDGLRKDPTNSEILSNLASISVYNAKTESFDKYMNAVFSSKPHYPLSNDIAAKSFLFDQCAARYK